MVVFVSRKQNQSQKRAQEEKLDHLLHHQKKEKEDESGSAALEAFRTLISTGLQELIASASSGVSFSWVKQGLNVLNGLETGFMSLTEALDCPMSTWGSPLADEYFSYTSHLLDAFNSITSALTRLQSLRLALAHALNSPSSSSSSSSALLSFSPPHRSANWAAESITTSRGARFHGHEKMVLEALLEMEAVAFWVCRVVVVGLGGEMVNSMAIHKPIHHDLGDDYGELMEVKEVNEIVSRLKEGDAPLLDQEDELEEMKTKVETFQRKLEGAVEDVNCLFHQVLASRNHLIDGFRLLQE